MKFSQSLTRTVSRQILTTKKNSPHIFFVAGVVGSVASTYLACRATLKLEDVVDESKHDVEQVKSAKSNQGREIDTKDYYKDLGYVYSKTVKSVVKLYGPSVALGIVSIGCLTGSHIQLTRRNAALTATVAAVSKAFDEYRDRVREKLGEDQERDIYHGLKEETIVEDGEKKKVKIVGEEGLSPYSRFFDDANPNWQKDSELNRLFIECQQKYANDRLHAYGHVMLNEVYDWLGLERSNAGAVVGWVKGTENGDGYISFGLFDERNIRFVNNMERVVILDFNVDGVVYDLIEGKKS
jgi:hypothetical protein